MGYDINRLQSAWAGGDYKTEEHRKAGGRYGAQDAEFSFLSMRDLPEQCRVKIRFLPPAPDKLPEGYLETAQHWLDPDLNNPSRKYRVTCLRPQQCYICDLLEALVPLRAAHKLEPKVTEALADSESNRQMLFVISVFATPTQTINEKTGKKKVTWGPPYDQEHGAILQVPKPSKLLDQIIPILAPTPIPGMPMQDVTSYSSGVYLDLTKSRYQYMLSGATPPCELINKELLTKYPDVKKRMGTVQQASYGEQETAIAGCWWADVPAVLQVRQALRQGGQVYSESGGLGPAVPSVLAFGPGPAVPMPFAAPPAATPFPSLPPPPGTTGPVIDNPFNFASAPHELPWN